MKFSRTQVCSLLVIIFHVVGFFGLSNPVSHHLFKQLVPFHLLLMFGLILYAAPHKNNDFWQFILITYTAGFIIELLGVNTGYIFGEYSYGPTLGIKLADIPLLIGVNWILMIYSAGAFLKEFPVRNRTLRAALAALLVTVVDFFIEPVAVSQDYWSWKGLEIPFQNYVAWFIFSFLLLHVFFYLHFNKKNHVAAVLFVVQLLFFISLNYAGV